MKNNKMSIISLILAILSIVLGFVFPINFIIICCILCLFVAIASIILGFISRKQIKNSNEKGKGFSLAGIIVGFISVALYMLSILGYFAMKDINYTDSALCPMDNYVKECVDNNDGTSSCKYMDVLEIKCSTNNLKENQFKN